MIKGQHGVQGAMGVYRDMLDYIGFGNNALILGKQTEKFEKMGLKQNSYRSSRKECRSFTKS